MNNDICPFFFFFTPPGFPSQCLYIYIIFFVFDVLIYHGDCLIKVEIGTTDGKVLCGCLIVSSISYLCEFVY